MHLRNDNLTCARTNSAMTGDLYSNACFLYGKCVSASFSNLRRVQFCWWRDADLHQMMSCGRWRLSLLESSRKRPVESGAGKGLDFAR